jgi:hypothetical protein
MEAKNTIADIVKSRINAFKEGYVFSYMDIEGPSKNREAIIKTLNRLAEKGILHKLSKGKFFKPFLSEYGKLGPDLNEIVKDLLEHNGEPIGYLTGFSIFNKMQLTTQLSSTIHIGRNTFKPTIKRGIYTIQFVLQNNLITKENIEKLQVLDCLKMIKGIPDATKDNSLHVLGKIIRKYKKPQRDILIQLSMKYPSSTRALLGMIFEEEKIMGPLDKIRETLNPISKFKITLRNYDKLVKQNWQIK